MGHPEGSGALDRAGQVLNDVRAARAPGARETEFNENLVIAVAAARIAAAWWRGSSRSEIDCIVSWLLVVWAYGCYGVPFTMTHEALVPVETLPNIGYRRWLEELAVLDPRVEEIGWDTAVDEPQALCTGDHPLAERFRSHRKLAVNTFAFFKKSNRRGETP